MRKKIIFILILFLITLAFFFYFFSSSRKLSGADDLTKNTHADAQIPIKTDRIEKITITDGATYGELMKRASTSYATAMEIYNAARPKYDLIKIRAGRILELIYDKDTNELKKLAYKIDSEDELNVQKICSSSIQTLGANAKSASTSGENKSAVSPLFRMRLK